MPLPDPFVSQRVNPINILVRWLLDCIIFHHTLLLIRSPRFPHLLYSLLEFSRSWSRFRVHMGPLSMRHFLPLLSPSPKSTSMAIISIHPLDDTSLFLFSPNMTHPIQLITLWIETACIYLVLKTGENKHRPRINLRRNYNFLNLQFSACNCLLPNKNSCTIIATAYDNVSCYLNTATYIVIAPSGNSWRKIDSKTEYHFRTL